MSMEQWKPVVEFPEYYEISNLGNLRRIVGGGSAQPGRPLNGGTAAGYRQFLLSIDRQVYPRYAHRLTLEAFVGPAPSPRHQVNHKDADRRNNDVANLEWVTPRENLHHAISLGLWSPRDSGRRARSRAGSGCGSVSWDSSKNRWRFRAVVDGRPRTIGRFEEYNQALAAKAAWNERKGQEAVA